MGKRSLLVRMPVRPLRFDALMPSLHLAKFAAAFEALGFSASIHDLGTPMHAAALYPAVDGKVVGAWDHLGGMWRSAGAAGRRQRNAWAEALAAKAGTLDAVLVYCEAPGDDLNWVRAFRRRHPGAVLLAAGPAVDRHTVWCRRHLPVDGTVVLPGAQVVYGPVRYRKEGLGGRMGGATGLESALEDVVRGVLPVFEAPVYGALHAAEAREAKLRLLPVGGPGRAVEFAAHMVQMAARTGMRSYAVLGSEWGAPGVEDLAEALMAQGGGVLYSAREPDLPRECTSFARLHASGCLAVSFGVETGSQRLQHDFYGRRTDVGKIERVLERVRREGLGVAVRLTFPCPADDWHTYAETLRFIERVRPEGVTVSEFAALPLASPQVMAPVLPRSRRWRAAYDPHVLQGIGGPVLGRPEEMGRAVSAVGIPVDTDERLVFIARMLGNGEQTAAFVGRVRCALAAGDLGALTALVDQFNTAAAASAPSMQPGNAA